jgi:hypothetical protein
MAKPSKSERRLLRELCSKAYDAEARATLNTLDVEFQRWRERQIGHAELLDAIHQFHQHAARDLWWRYASNDVLRIVQGAAARGFVAEADVPDAIRPLVEWDVVMAPARLRDPRSVDDAGPSQLGDAAD